MSERSSQLERALDVWLAFRATGGPRAELLARHPDLADLLAAMFDDEAEPAGDGDASLLTLGDYRILREVGRGGMGIVYEAKQRSLDRRVALKILAPGMASSPTTLARFRREALHLARLDHPGIVRVFDVGETDGQHWLAMEFVDGVTLADRLGELQATGHAGATRRQFVVACAQVADALAHAHAQGLVHRDVKPSNVFLRRDGTAVLGDFGLARDYEGPTVTRAGTIAGTPDYMAPEQIRGGGLDARSDVWSLGVTLYECLTLRRPFSGPTVEVTLHRVLHRDPVDPRRLHRGLPADLAAVTLEALEKVPSRRYQGAAEFAADLRAFLDLRPVQARQLSTLTRIHRWMRREPGKAAIAAMGVFCLAVGATYVARLPDLRAAAAMRVENEYDEAITNAVLALGRRDRGACLRDFARALAIAPGRAEAQALQVTALKNFDGVEVAAAALERAAAAGAGDELQRTRVWLLRLQGRDAEAAALEAQLGPPTTPTAMLLAVAALTGGEMTAEQRREVYRTMSLAVRIAPQPRLLLHAQWAVLAPPEATSEVVDSLLRLWPEQPLALHIAGARLVASEPARAVELCRRARQLGLDEGNVALSHVNSGAAHVLLQQHDEAIDELQAGLQGNLQAGQRVAAIDLLHRLAPDAEERACRDWLARDPGNALALRKLGQVLSFAEQHQEAIDCMRRAAAARPADPEYQYDLAVALDSASEAKAAIAPLHAVLELDPGNDRAHQRLHGVLQQLRDVDGLFAELQRRCRVRADDVVAWTGLASTLLALDRAEEALAAAEHADYASSGKDPAVLAVRAQVLDKLGESVAAERCRERAAQAAAARANDRGGNVPGGGR